MQDKAACGLTRVVKEIGAAIKNETLWPRAPDAIAAHLHARFAVLVFQDSASALLELTARERSVLLAIAEVGGVPETARALKLSEGTVKSYLKSIFQKTRSRRQADLVKLALLMESPFLVEEPARALSEADV